MENKPYYYKCIERYQNKSKYKDTYLLYVDNYRKKFAEGYSEEIRIKKYTDIFYSEIYKKLITGAIELDFFLSSKTTCDELITYILDYLTSTSEIFYNKKNGIILEDFHDMILHITTLRLNNMIIDKKLIHIINKFFKNLKGISFSNCLIMEDCYFANLDKLENIKFLNCTIKDFNSFDLCRQNLEFEDCNIEKIKNGVIYSNYIKINAENDNLFEKIFVMNNFPSLLELNLKCPKFDKSLPWLSTSCPNLKQLRIEGNVPSFDFLYKFHNLDNAEIESTSLTYDYFYTVVAPYITDEKEREKILSKSNRKIEDEFDSNIILKEQLYKINSAIRKISYTEEEKNIYINNKIPMILFEPRKKEVKFYYLFNRAYNKMDFRIQKRYEDSKIINNQLYVYRNFLDSANMRQLFVFSKFFIYHPSGIPIVFDNKNEVRPNDDIERCIKGKNKILYYDEGEDKFY